MAYTGIFNQIQKYFQPKIIKICIIKLKQYSVFYCCCEFFSESNQP